MAIVMPLVKHPNNPNGVIVYDLSHAPKALLTLNEDEIHHRLYTATADLPEGVERIPLKTVHINKAPVIVPMNTLTDEVIERWGVDMEAIKQHRQQILEATGLKQKIISVHQKMAFEPITDPDRMLYCGGFFSDADRIKMDSIRRLTPAELAEYPLDFDDDRLPEMLFRYRARNWPEWLSTDERDRWEEYRHQRLHDEEGGGSIAITEYNKCLHEIRDLPEHADNQVLLNALVKWGESVE
jgi:exodeoxyribonuclease-1